MIDNDDRLALTQFDLDTPTNILIQLRRLYRDIFIREDHFSRYPFSLYSHIGFYVNGDVEGKRLCSRFVKCL